MTPLEAFINEGGIEFLSNIVVKRVLDNTENSPDTSDDVEMEILHCFRSIFNTPSGLSRILWTPQSASGALLALCTISRIRTLHTTSSQLKAFTNACDMLSTLLTLGAVTRESVLQAVSAAGLSVKVPSTDRSPATFGPVSIFTVTLDNEAVHMDPQVDSLAFAKAKTSALIFLNILVAREGEAESPLPLETRILIRAYNGNWRAGFHSWSSEGRRSYFSARFIAVRIGKG